MSIWHYLSSTLTVSLSEAHFPLTVAFSSTSRSSSFSTHGFLLTHLFSVFISQPFFAFFTLKQISPAFVITSEKHPGYPVAEAMQAMRPVMQKQMDKVRQQVEQQVAELKKEYKAGQAKKAAPVSN
jgi:hypothetical protein